MSEFIKLALYAYGTGVLSGVLLIILIVFIWAGNE
jgi:hypothetical protein